ncbi:MAG: hypothetical protein R3F14_36605 [Polyangiaceae bacterium]
MARASPATRAITAGASDVLLAADTLVIDMDRMRLTVVWRASFIVPDEAIPWKIVAGAGTRARTCIAAPREQPPCPTGALPSWRSTMQITLDVRSTAHGELPALPFAVLPPQASASPGHPRRASPATTLNLSESFSFDVGLLFAPAPPPRRFARHDLPPRRSIAREGRPAAPPAPAAPPPHLARRPAPPAPPSSARSPRSRKTSPPPSEAHPALSFEELVARREAHSPARSIPTEDESCLRLVSWQSLAAHDPSTLSACRRVLGQDCPYAPSSGTEYRWGPRGVQARRVSVAASPA